MLLNIFKLSYSTEYSRGNLKLMLQGDIRIRLNYRKQFSNGNNDIKTRANYYKNVIIR